RVAVVLAVLEKRLGLSLANQDVYVSVAGGVRVEEPAVDLAIAVAVASSLLDRPVPDELVVLGEVGLSGEVRSCTQASKRLSEAQRLGFERAVLPGRNAEGDGQRGIRLEGVGSVKDALAKTVLP
ncbi:MAG: magnesium chelatase domain-containing protein, partial [Armatimonadaceae bacterium]